MAFGRSWLEDKDRINVFSFKGTKKVGTSWEKSDLGKNQESSRKCTFSFFGLASSQFIKPNQHFWNRIISGNWETFSSHNCQTSPAFDMATIKLD